VASIVVHGSDEQKLELALQYLESSSELSFKSAGELLKELESYFIPVTQVITKISVGDDKGPKHIKGLLKRKEDTLFQSQDSEWTDPLLFEIRDGLLIEYSPSAPSSLLFHNNLNSLNSSTSNNRSPISPSFPPTKITSMTSPSDIQSNVISGKEHSLSLVQICRPLSNFRLSRTFFPDDPVVFKLDSPESHSLYLKASTEEEKNKWIIVLLSYYLETEYNRYNSFAPMRRNVSCFWYVNGKPFYTRLADALEQAKESIFLTCWMISPQVYLRKSYPPSIDNRFDRILLRLAKNGVQIYMILWNETKVTGSGLNSAYCKEYLEKLHSNFHVMQHPQVLPMIWGHHQKILVIDQDHSFQGGFDVCWGRWDDEYHRVSDDCHLALEWPGKDYFNPLILGTCDVDKPFEDNLDREKFPRMPWHDTQTETNGLCARDVSNNFIERWNLHRLDLLNEEMNKKVRDDLSEHYPILSRKSNAPSNRILDSSIPKVFYNNVVNDYHEKMDTCIVQNVRSITRWSGSLSCEASCYYAYLDLIRRAEHYIYLENQYFVSDSADGVQNQLSSAILSRIRWAIENKKKFRVVLVLPITPDGDYRESTTIRCIMYWQLQTICRGGKSIVETLEKEYPTVDWTQYFAVISLRSYGQICGNFVSEQVYTHSKFLIVDDNYVIIGSANTNDRSFLGDRDSELCQIIEDSSKISSLMDGKKCQVSRFVNHFRMFLFKELVGSTVDEHLLLDPVSDDTWNLLMTIAQKNTEIFEDVFPYIPSNKIQKYSQIVDKQDQFQTNSKYLDRLKDVKGLIVLYPLQILSQESLYPTFQEYQQRYLSHNMFQ